MVRHLRILLIVSVILGGAVYILPSHAYAAGASVSLTTSPVSLDLQIKPGTSTTKTLQLMNNTSQPIPITMLLKMFGPSGNAGEASITSFNANDPSVNWVHFSPSFFVAQPGVWESVQMSISLPASAQLGYYYAVVFQPTIPTSQAPRATTIKTSNAILVLIDTDSGNEKRQVKIAGFSVSKKVYEYLPATFNITVQNAGNIFLSPTGDIFISKNSNFTNTIATLPVNAANSNVLPNSVRIFQETWTSGFPVFQQKMIDGQPVTVKNKPVYQLHWNFSQANNFRFGKYYAQLALIYNNGSEQIPVTSTVSFWVIPWKLMLILLVIILFILAGLFSIGRLIFRRVRGVKKL